MMMMSSAGLLTRVARSVYARSMSMSFSQGTRGFCSATTGTEAANSNAKTAGERVLNDYLCSTSEEEERRELERVLAQRQSRRHAAGDGDEDGRVRAEGGLDGAADSGQSLSAAQVEAEAAEARRAAARARRLRRADGPNPMAVAIGRRKASVAKVYLTGVDVEAEQYPDTYDPHHSATVNGMPAAQYFGNDVNAVGSALMPLLVTNYARPSWRVEAKVRGGGTTGQAGAIRLGTIVHTPRSITKERSIYDTCRSSQTSTHFVSHDVRTVNLSRTRARWSRAAARV